MSDNPYGVTVYSGSAGVNANAAQLITDMQMLGLSWLRYQVNWSLIESPQGTYTWTGLDDIVSRCNTASINILFTISGAPSWALSTTSQKATNEPFFLPDPTLTAGFASAVAGRYNGGAHGLMNAIEVGNEDFNIHFSANGVTGFHASPYTEYNATGGNVAAFNIQPARDPYFLVPVMQACAPAIRSASSSTKVGLAAVWWLYWSNVGDFITGLYSGLGSSASTYFDYVNLHFYPGSQDPLISPNPGVQPSIIDMWTLAHNAMVASGDTKTPLWITEFGYATNFNNQTNPIPAEYQSNYFQKVYIAARLSKIVSKCFFYTLAYNSDGMSLVQGPSPYNYLPAFTWLQGYISQYPNWNPLPAKAPGFML